MERYHMYKLGIAILFYAIYYRRLTIVGALSTYRSGDGDEYVYYQGVQGKPGVDFPVYARIPRTTFSCKKVESGYYADLETSCQVFHICNGGAKISFLCPNGTIFQQSELICEWWFKVNCTDSPNYYSESAEHLREESWKRKSWRKAGQNRNGPTRRKPQVEASDNRQPSQNEIPNQQGAIGNNLGKQLVQSGNGQSKNKIPISRSDYGKSVDPSSTRTTNSGTRPPTEEIRRKQANGARGGRKFKEDNFNNLNVRNELTENDSTTSEETQVPEETASFYKNNQNVIESSDKPTTNRYPNHKETYSEIQEVKFYTTKTSSRFSQTIPPQTYATNRIPLNDGKPFVISTPKSSYNIHFTGYTNDPSDYSRVTTEYFRYSPTVPPFTTARKLHTTTVIPKIIVDGDIGSEPNESGQYDEFSSTFASSNYGQKQKPDYRNEYTTPNSIRIDDNHKGISFTERVNSFSGLEDIIHTPSTGKYDKLNIQTSSGGDIQNKVIGNGYETTIRDYSSAIQSTSSKYEYNIANVNQEKNNSKVYETTTKDSYYPSVVRSTSDKYGVDIGNVNQNKPNGVSVYDSTTKIGNQYSTTFSSNKRGGGFDNGHPDKITGSIQDKDYTYQNGRQATAPGDTKVTDSSAKFEHKSFQNPTASNIDEQLKKDVSQNVIESSKVQPSNSLPTLFGKNENNVGTSSGYAYNTGSNINPNIVAEVRTPSLNSDLTANFVSKNKEKPGVAAAQDNSHVSQNNRNNVDVSQKEPEDQSSYGDACGDDIVYPELSKDQIVVGKKKIVIDDTSVPTTETNIIRITVSNIKDDGLSDKEPLPDRALVNSKPVTDSAIFRLNLKGGDSTAKETDRDVTEKPNDYFVTKLSNNNGELLTLHPSTAFSSANTYLPKQSSFSTSTENYNKNLQTKPHTYLPKGSTPVPFSANDELLNNKEILKEGNGFPQSVHTRENHLKTSAGVPQISEEIQKEFALKPKPFELPPKETNEVKPTSRSGFEVTGAPLPDYKVSSARPFSFKPRDYDENTVLPTSPTPFPNDSNKISEHLSSMLNTLREIVNRRAKSNETDSPRPGLIIPPSVGPQTLHTLAVYFANALDGISSENVSEELPSVEEAQAINELLTHSTLNKYRELFKDEDDQSEGTTLPPEEETESANDLEGQHSKTAVTPRVQQLAQVFTKALSSYLDDPDMFRKALQEARPTEPSPTDDKDARSGGNDDDELLNYSDADIKPHLPRLSTTTPSPNPTWGYILAPNNSNSYEYNSLNVDGENLQSADSQSFATQFNNYVKEKHFGKGISNIQSTTPLSVSPNENNLPTDHWTASANATKLWQDKLYTNPQSINENLNTGLLPPDSQESPVTEEGSSLKTADINYSLSSFPKDDLNSTQVHRILVDIVNSTTDDGNKLKRILNKLNTTQEDFLTKMREIEQNPLTRRLILLLISECGSNITRLESKINSDKPSSTADGHAKETAHLFESSRVAEQNKFSKGSSPFPVYVDPSLKDEDEDNRALQLLNSLYTIASRYGK